MEKSVFLSSGIDRVFVDCLREIERSYVHLPKQQRIRIEKWVEKLVLTGKNPVWQKHRNAYAKLLLNMVLTGNLTDPFHALPPDGPLPTFPHHLKSYTKNLLGAHESAFWHELYNRVNMHEEVGEKSHSHSVQKKDSDSHEVAPVKEEVKTSKDLTTLPQSREISNLNFLIKEQNRRIQLLEEQLHSERTQHELQLQRLQYTHRIEVGTLRNELYKATNGGANMTNIGNSTLDLDYSRASPIKSSGMPFQSTRRSSPIKTTSDSHFKSPSSSSSSSALRPRPSSSSAATARSGASESRYGLGSTVGASTVTLPANATGAGATITSGSTATLDSVFDLSHSTSHTPATAARTATTSGSAAASEGTTAASVASTQQQPSHRSSQHHHHHVPGSPPLHPPRPVPDDLYDSLSVTSQQQHAEIIPQHRPRSLSGSSISSTGGGGASPGNHEDRDFMAYISQFQKEINKINHTLQSSMVVSSPSSQIDSPGSVDGVAGLGLHHLRGDSHQPQEQQMLRSEFSD